MNKNIFSKHDLHVLFILFFSTMYKIFLITGRSLRAVYGGKHFFFVIHFTEK